MLSIWTTPYMWCNNMWITLTTRNLHQNLQCAYMWIWLAWWVKNSKWTIFASRSSNFFGTINRFWILYGKSNLALCSLKVVNHVSFASYKAIAFALIQSHYILHQCLPNTRLQCYYFVLVFYCWSTQKLELWISPVLHIPLAKCWVSTRQFQTLKDMFQCLIQH